MDYNPTWADLHASARSTPEKITLELRILPHLGNSYPKFVGMIERALDCSFQFMAQAKNLIGGLSEDQLTIMLLAYLRGMAFDASHDPNVGGHCDIVISGPDEMLWLGEAKLYAADYTKLLSGFLQLTDRYSTGLKNQSCGGLIIYTAKAGAADMMANWEAYLREAEPTLTIERIADRPLEFRSSRPHRATQQSFVVRHSPVILFHEPTDPLPAPPRTRRHRA